ncbi:MAG: lipopolysaccharide heptosyltransferase I [Deltaproteobacteria bacterium]|nr:lipopolysaccharide heptosyltransferase I [Deltaproteobacteria bacterium]
MRILLIRTSALGDVVHTLPVLTALRRHFPEGHIGWVVESSMAPILQGHPDLDELIPVRFRAWRKRLTKTVTWKEMLQFRRAIRSFQADVVVDLMGNHKAGAVAALTGCNRRIGFARRSRREPSSSLWINEGVHPRRLHAVERALELLEPLGVPFETPDFQGSKLFQGAALGDLQQVLPAPSRPIALLIPGAGWHNKRYPTDSWGRVATQLRDHGELSVLIPCGPGEEPLSEKIVDASHGAATNLGLVKLPALAALIRRSGIVLGGDTGPIHLAHALGTPVLCTMGPTTPYRHGPYGEADWAIWQELPCSFCYRRFTSPKACLQSLSVERVVSRALEILRNLN